MRYGLCGGMVWSSEVDINWRNPGRSGMTCLMAAMKNYGQATRSTLPVPLFLIKAETIGGNTSVGYIPILFVPFC